MPEDLMATMVGWTTEDPPESNHIDLKPALRLLVTAVKRQLYKREAKSYINYRGPQGNFTVSW